MSTDINLKYSDLRKSLDDMNIYETLHPDSVPLAQKLLKLLNGYIKKIRDSDHLKKSLSTQSGIQPSNNTSRNDDSILEHKLDLLNKQLCDSKEQLRLRDEQLQILKNSAEDHGRIKEVRDKYDNKINQFLAQEKMLQNRQKQLYKKNQTLEDNVTSLNRLVDTLKDQLYTARKDIQSQCREKQMFKKQYDDIVISTGSLDTRRIQEMNSILERKIARVKELQDQDIIAKSKLATLKKQTEYMEVERKQLQLENKTINCVVESLKVENEDLNRTNTKMKLSIDELNREIEANKRHRTSLEQQIQNLKVSEFQRNTTNETRQLIKDRLTNQYEDTVKALQAQKLENQSVMIEKNQLESQVQKLEGKVKQLSNKNLILNKNIHQLQEQLNLSSSKLSQKIKQNRELQVQKLQLERAVKDIEPAQQRYLEMQAKYNQLLVSGDASDDMQTKSRRQYQHCIKVLKEEVDVMKEREQQSIGKTEKLSNEMRRLQTYMENGNRQIELLNSQKQNLMKENKSLKEELDSHLMKTHSISTEGIKQTQKINSNEILIQDLKSTLNAETQKVKALLQQNKLLQANIRKTESKNRQLHEDNVKLKTMCESLETNKNQLWGKLKRTHSDRGQIEIDKKKHSQDYLKLRSQYEMCKQQLQQKSRGILQIDQLRDEIQRDLNNKNVENDELSRRVGELQESLRRHDQALGENELSLRGYQSNNNVLQAKFNKAMQLQQKLQTDLHNANAIIKRYQTDMERQASQRGLLIANNNDKNKQMECLRTSLTRLQQLVNQRTKQADQNRTSLQIMKLQNQQLDERCQALINEKKRLQNIVLELEGQNHSMYQHLSQRDQELGDARHQFTTYNQRILQYEAEIVSYEKQLTIVSNQLNLRDEDFKRTAMERDYLKSEVSTSRREPQIDWKSVMEERLMQAQCQLQLKKRQVESHIVQNRKLQKVIENERMINFQLNNQIQQGKQGSHLETPIRNLICESLEASQIENSSIHSNRGDFERGIQSFQSNNTVNSNNSRQVQNEFHRIKQKYINTINGMENIKSQRI